MTANAVESGGLSRWLSRIEAAGNRLPDPAVLFAGLMLTVWLLSWWSSTYQWGVIDPRTNAPLVVNNLLDGASFGEFMARLWRVFIEFPPLGTVIVAMIGIGVADASGMINAGLRALLGVTARQLLTPMVVAVGLPMATSCAKLGPESTASSLPGSTLATTSLISSRLPRSSPLEPMTSGMVGAM